MQRNTIILLALIILSGCANTIETPDNTTYTRSAIDARIQLTNDAIDSTKNGVIFSISDFEKAARTSMHVGDELTLPTSPQAHIQLIAANSTHATFVINDEEHSILQGQQVAFMQGQLNVYVARTN